MEQQGSKDTGHATPPVIYCLQPQEPATGEGISVPELWRALLPYKWLMISLTTVATVAAIIYALSLPPVYRAEAVLAPASSDNGGQLNALSGGLGGLASLAGISVGATNSVTDRAIAVLNSRAFTRDFLAAERLPDDTGKIHAVARDDKTGLVTLTVEWEDPEKAAHWANLLVERLNRHEQHEAIDEAEKSIEYLNQQLSKTSDMEMRQVIFRLIDAQERNVMLANVRDQFAFKVIDPAVPPKIRSGPHRKIIVAIGGGVGLAGSGIISFVLSLIRKWRHEESETGGS